MTEELERRYYAEHPVFVFDRTDDSNRPVRGVHVNVINRWDVFPEKLSEAFEYTFSYAVMKNERPRLLEKEWQQIFRAVKTMIIPCGGCGHETFYDISGGMNRCINCGTPINLPVSLKTPFADIPLYPGKMIYPCEIEEDGSETPAAGIVVKGTKNPNIWGLKNLTGDTWTLIDQDGNEILRETEAVSRIRPGNRLIFSETAESEFTAIS
jgi:hypothetical protein